VTFAVPAEAYERFVGRYSYTLADALVGAAGLGGDETVLDVGAGSGAGTRRLVERVGAARVAAVDPSEPFVQTMQERFPQADVRQGRAEELPFSDDAFDASLAQLVVNFMSEPEAGVGEMLRVTRPGGVVAACVWDYGDRMTLLGRFWDAAAALDPEAAAAVDERSGMRFGRRGELAELWRAVGLAAVEDGELVVFADYDDFEDLWSPFTAGVGPAGSYAAGLDPERQAALKAEYRRRLDVPDGPFRLSARAWYAVGRA
jgi:SAM-dependent methyltransferase